MDNRIARREVTKQIAITIELLLEWFEQKENSNVNSPIGNVEEETLET